MRRGLRVIGSPQHRVRARFRTRPRSYSLRRFSMTLGLRGILPYALLLFRVPSFSNPARNLSAASSTCLGFFPHRDSTRARPLIAKLPVSLRSVLRFSQPLDGFLRARARRLVSSRCHVQDSSCSRSSPFAQPPSLVGRSMPPCRCPPVAHLILANPAATTNDLGFEALICEKMRSTG